MKGLFVGARVRIKWSRAWPELAGQTGRIVCRQENSGLIARTPNCEWVVAPDCWNDARAPYPSLGAHFFGPASVQLEPIEPSGASPGTMSYQELMDRLRTGKIKG